MGAELAAAILLIVVPIASRVAFFELGRTFDVAMSPPGARKPRPRAGRSR